MRQVTLNSFAWFALGCLSLSAAEFDQSHPLYAKVLQRFVTNSLVDYAALRNDRKDLDLYLAKIAAVPEADFRKWTKDDQLALLLNLYNAATFALVANHYPLKSIRDIGLLPLAPWKAPIVKLFGTTTTLYALENDLIRRDYPEHPEIHFALVCAARGCPPLRGEPYLGAKLPAQLHDQARQFLAMPQKNRVDLAARTVYLSKIFDWYAEDFGGSDAAVLEYVKRFLPPGPARALEKGSFRIRYIDYDWSLNDAAGAK